jgi:hypothetical protein
LLLRNRGDVRENIRSYFGLSGIVCDGPHALRFRMMVGNRRFNTPKNENKPDFEDSEVFGWYESSFDVDRSARCSTVAKLADPAGRPSERSSTWWRFPPT